jgi:hypothetical protein
VAGGLFGLLDDVAALAKAAAASIDDVGLAAGRASAKAAGVVVDDAAVTPAYVQGLAAERELPIIKRIARGSLRNKLVFILPAALVLSEFVPLLVEVVLMFGGCFLAYEGAHKVHGRLHRHDEHGPNGTAGIDPVLAGDTDAEAGIVRGAIRTDFILSAEIMVIALKDVIDEPFVTRAVVLLIVAVGITALVYGVVALIVKMDDVGLRLATTGGPTAQRIGRGLVNAMPRVLAVLAVVGTAAMLWVGGHILLVGAHELGWHTPYDALHRLDERVAEVPGVGGVLAWLVDTSVSAVVGLAVGWVILLVVARIPLRRSASA